MRDIPYVVKFTIYGRLDGLNDYTRACRSGYIVGDAMKKRNEKAVLNAIHATKLARIDKYPVKLRIAWYEPNRRRDVDNITFAIKFIQDALVKCGVLENDNQSHIDGVYHDVSVDKSNPRIEVEIIERT